MNMETVEKQRKFNYLVSEIDEAYHDAALKIGLSDSCMQVLYSICDSGKCCSLSNVYKMSGISKQTVNSAIRKLEKDGIVYLRDLNGRAKEILLTEKGEQLVQNSVMRIIKIENEIFNRWGSEKLDLYLALTQDYLEEFKKKISLL